MSKNIEKYLRTTVLFLGKDGNVLNPITEDMFEEKDIKKIETNEKGIVFIWFYGINGGVVFSSFSFKAKEKLKNILKKRNSPLWCSINDK